MKNYTPTSEFNEYPVSIMKNGDDVNESTFDILFEDIHNRFKFLKDELDSDDSSNDALIENLNNNVGGGVTGEDEPVYEDTTIITSGDSHHVALEKLDGNLTTNNTNTAQNNLLIQSNLDKITYIVDKIDPAAANSSPFTYLSNNFLVNETRIKHNLEEYDRLLLGIRRTGEFSYGLAFDSFVKTLINLGDDVFISGYETFYDSSKYDNALTDATIDTKQRQASGSDKYIVWKKSTSGDDIVNVLFDYDLSSGGSIEVRFSCTDETTWASMETYSASKGTYQAVLAQGQDLAIKVKIAGTAKLYNFRYVTKGT